MSKRFRGLGWTAVAVMVLLGAEAKAEEARPVPTGAPAVLQDTGGSAKAQLDAGLRRAQNN